MKRQCLLMIVLALAVVSLLAAAVPALAQEPGIQSPPDVYFIRLQPVPDVSAAPADGLRAAYERLEPALLKLVADGQIVAFEFLPEIGAVRAIAFEASLQPLASRPEVEGIVPLHPHQVAPPEVQAAPSLDIPDVKPAAPDTPPPDILPTDLPVSPMGEIITYSWVNNQGPTPPIEYNWTEISATGTIVAQGDDTFSPIELGFPFTFYGTTYTSAYVSSNGFVSFGSGSSSYGNGTIPSPDMPNNAIYALWDDLFPSGGADGNVYAKKVAATTYVVEWYRVRRSSSYETFEIILDGADNTITLQYQTVAGGSSATVGVENSTGSGATQYAYNTSAAIFNGLAVKFTPAATLAYTIGGVVRDYDTTPVPSARVDVVAGPISVSGFSDAHGAYSLTVIAGTYTLRAQKDGYFITPERTVTVPPDQPGVDLSFPARYTIQGTVRDFDDTVIKDARVSTKYNDPVSTSNYTDATGAYELIVTAGTYHVGVSKSNLPSPPDQVITVPPDVTVNFTYLQRYTISGKVLDWDGTPIADARVSTKYNDPVSTSDYTDATGAYELIVTAGTYHVGVSKSNLPSPADQVVTVPPDAPGVNFTYPRRYAIRGTARNYDGAPVQGAYMSTSWNDPVYASAQTDASGAYTLTVTAGTFTIGASKTGFPDPEDRQVTVPPDATGVDFTFPQPFPISGTVRDGAGQPVQGASVWGGISSVTTAADGTYTTMAGPGDHYVSAHKDGYLSASSVLVPVPPAATGVDFVLLIENQTITGRVTDNQGQPLADAYVSASSIDCSSPGSEGTHTAGDGTYTLALPVGTYHVKASKDGFIPAPSELVKLPASAVQAVAAQVNFALEPLAYTIRGIVRDSQGQPMENAWVYASACGLSYSADTDATGAYTLTVSANTYSVYASKSDYPDAPAQTVSAPPNADHVDFVLPPVYTISGRVTDPQGHPLADIWVGTDYSGPDSDSDYTDADGKYTLYLAAGSYRIGAEKDGYDWPHRTVAVPPNQTDIDFVLTPVSLRIQGFVRDSAGRGVARSWVCPTLTGENTSFFCKTAYYNGAYSKLLPAGTYRVSASASCYTSATISGVTLPPDRTGLDFTIKLRDQLIAGRATDSEGQPVCGASMRAKDGESDYDTTERNGRYSLNVPAGAYKVSASKSGYGTPTERNITVPPSTTSVNFVFQAPSNTIQGIVRDNHGAAMAGVSISASGSGGTVTAVTGADGSYTIRVLNGNWNVVASKPGYLTSPSVRTFTVPPNQVGANFTLIARSELTRSTYLPLILRGQ